MIVSLKEGGRFTWTSSSGSRVVASSALGFIFILSIRLIRSLQYETFLNPHLILALVALIAIWCHIPEKKAATLFLRFGICLWVAMSMVHWCLFVFRNFVFGRAFATAVVKPLSNQRKPSELDLEQAMQVDVSNKREIDPEEIMQVDITILRPWRVRAGQHIFISIPKLGILRGLRGHPFVITWWDRDITGLTVTLLIKSRTGFTRELRRHVEKPLRVFVDGPFGIRHNFGDYGTVVMVATGIGIAGYIPYLKELISGYNSYEILEISLHAQEYGKKDEAYSSHNKLNKSFGPLDVEGLLQKELSARRGRIIVSRKPPAPPATGPTFYICAN
ncbi:hypothetical protein V496_00877 [Pseudogymnoascus sp. VKM F-4515 (FW-2607)]|nr:hypothetical protein V496_00877 [Pseudogymnoascus sp. VKM F-4515 (FW-2607)]